MRLTDRQATHLLLILQDTLRFADQDTKAFTISRAVRLQLWQRIIEQQEETVVDMTGSGEPEAVPLIPDKPEGT